MSALHASDFFTKGRIMTGKTHAAVGLGTVLAVTQPSTVSGLVLAAGTGMLGALISDIDVGTSKSHKDADRITLIAVLLVAAEIALNYFCNFSIWDHLSGRGRIHCPHCSRGRRRSWLLSVLPEPEESNSC